jgi:hypothetical protein
MHGRGDLLTSGHVFADADPWASGDQRYVDDAERWGETVGTTDATDEASRLYEPRITAYSQ